MSHSLSFWNRGGIRTLFASGITIAALFIISGGVSAETLYQLYDATEDKVIDTYSSETQCRLMKIQLGRGECIAFEMNIGDEEEEEESGVTTWKLVRTETGEVLFDSFPNIGACGSLAIEMYSNENVQCVKSDTIITPEPDTSLDDILNPAEDGEENSSSGSGNILDRFRETIVGESNSSRTSGSESDDGYILLEPSLIGQSKGSTVQPGDYLYGVFWFMLGAAGVLAVLTIAIGGIEYMVSGANPSKKKEGQEKMTAAIFGLLLALGAWLILNTINPDFVNFDLELDRVMVSGNPGVGTNTEGSVEYEGYELCNPDGTVAGSRYSDKETCEKNIPEGSSLICMRQCPGSEVQAGACNAPSSHKQWLTSSCEYSISKLHQENALREEYQKRNIVINNFWCMKPTQKSGCTDIVGMKSATEAELFRIADAVKGVTVTGGTEVDSHAISGKSHPNGYKFDLRLETSLNNYITQNFTQLSPCSHGSACYKAPSGAIYYRESDHWDVLVP